MARDPRRFAVRPCNLCPSWPPGSVGGTKVYHKHYSSCMERRACSGPSFYCAPCKMSHSPEIPGRIRVCVTASFLHEFWLPRDFRVQVEGNPFHVDYLSVPGAGILDLAEIFKFEYRAVAAPLDVVLVCFSSPIIFF